MHLSEQEARVTLARVRDEQHAQKVETKRKAAADQQWAGDAATQLALAAAQPPMAMTLESLKGALNAARAAGVAGPVAAADGCSALPPELGGGCALQLSMV